ncbi:MAG: response regulator transcription factor [Deltaproteobacteria bacterium]|nr:response regulator transcription factor [Deltaproteobacteria bacterium]
MTTILAVDDSATMRTCLEITFAGTDLRVVCCEGAAALLDELGAERPALVLVDSSLPPSSGYDLCAAIRASAPKIPILLLTSRHHPFDTTRADVVDDHLDKPFEPQELYDRAKALVASGPRVTSESAPELEFADADLDLDEPVPPLEDAGEAGLAGLLEPDGEADLGGLLEPDGPARTMPTPFEPAFAVPAAREPAFAVPEYAASEGSFDLPAPPFVESERSARPRGVTAAWEVSDELRSYRAAAVGFEPAKEAAREVTASWDMSSGVPVAASAPVAAPALAAALEVEHAGLSDRLAGLGLTEAQVQAVVAMSREVIERVAWEVVPTLAETIIKEELRRLTQA